MRYFAYGSNLDLMQMAQRCPAAKLVGPAQLANHRICFPRRSPVRGCAVASFEAYRGGVVWGVIYELDEDDLKRLDEREGFDPVNPSAVNRYCRVDVTVQHTAGERIEAVAYVAVPEENPGRPSRDYLKHIIEGAAAHSFPDDYIEALRAIVAHEDDDVAPVARSPSRPDETTAGAPRAADASAGAEAGSEAEAGDATPAATATAPRPQETAAKDGE